MKNPYSKYRLDSGYDPKFRVENNTSQVYGVETRAFKDNIKDQLSDIPMTWINNGATWVVNHVYRCTQINKVDQPMVDDKNAPKMTFFKLFKL